MHGNFADLVRRISVGRSAGPQVHRSADYGSDYDHRLVIEIAKVKVTDW